MGHYQVAHDARTPLRQQSAPSALSRSWAANRHGRRSAPGAEETAPRMSARRKPREKLICAANPVVATHNGKPTLMLRIGNGRTGLLTDAAAKLNVSVMTTEGKLFRSAQELRLERAHIPAFPLSWTLMHVLDERSPLHGFDTAQFIAADARVFVTVEARDPALATVVHDFRNYTPEDICFGMRYADVVTTAEDGTLVVDLTRIGALEADVGERREQGWTELEDVRE